MKINFNRIHKLQIILCIIISTISCQNSNKNIAKPHVAFSFDDGNVNDILSYKGEVFNGLIRKQLKDNNIKAVWYVKGKSVDNEKGKVLLKQWNDDGHILANHTYSHLNYNDSSMTCLNYIQEIYRCDSIIHDYKNYKKIFRFPFLKGGNTVAKRDSIITFLNKNGYKQGWVTIDASDWYINMRLIRRLKQNPEADISGFRDYYINHILNRAQYYNNLSKEINHKQISHTVLLHFNLTSALFLNDLIQKFKTEGWIIDNYSDAIKDSVYLKQPIAMPAEQSLIWLMAKQTGKYKLRYPGEDGCYEKDKMDELGL